MERFYVLESNTQLRKSGQHLLLMKGSEKLAEIPLEGLQQLTLLGYASLTGAVLDTLIRHRVETVLLSPQGRFRGRLLVDEHKHVQRRQAQYVRLSDKAFALHTARAVVKGKLQNTARFLAMRGAQHKDQDLVDTAARLKAYIHMAAEAKSLDSLRGIEGQGARLYFKVFHRLIKAADFTFTGRSRRPPLDPMNALLSFMYTLLTLEVLTAIKIVGLDPYLGALHDIEYGRPSLACDLVEEWRPFMADRFVLSLVNKQIVRADDFIHRSVPHTDAVDEEDLKGKRPVEMKPKISRAFIQAYEKWMTSQKVSPEKGYTTDYRGMIRYQAQLFCKYLLGEKDVYQPFLWSHVF